MEHTLKQIKDNWIVLVFITSLIVTWTTFNSRLAKAEQDILTLQQISSQIQEININMAVVKTDINYIKESIK